MPVISAKVFILLPDRIIAPFSLFVSFTTKFNYVTPFLFPFNITKHNIILTKVKHKIQINLIFVRFNLG